SRARRGPGKLRDVAATVNDASLDWGQLNWGQSPFLGGGANRDCPNRERADVMTMGLCSDSRKPDSHKHGFTNSSDSDVSQTASDWISHKRSLTPISHK